MPINLAVDMKLDRAQRQLEAFNKAAERDFRAVANSLEVGITKSLKKLEAKDALRGIAAVRGVIQDLGPGLGQAGKNLDEFLGAVQGGVPGVISAMTQQLGKQMALNTKIEEATTEAKRFIEAAKGMDRIDLSQAQSAVDKLRDSIKETMQSGFINVFGDLKTQLSQYKEVIALEAKAKEQAAEQAKQQKAVNALMDEGAKFGKDVWKILTEGPKGAKEPTREYGKTLKEATDPITQLFKGVTNNDLIPFIDSLGGPLSSAAKMKADTDQILRENIQPIEIPFEAKFSSDMELFAFFDRQRRDVFVEKFKESAKQMGDAIANAFGQKAGEAVGTLFNRLQDGEKIFAKGGKGFAKMTSEVMKSIGTQLFAQGVSDELRGLGMTILGNVIQGPPLMALGGIEMASGLAMGGIGSLIGRSAGLKSGASRGGGVDGGPRMRDADRASQTQIQASQIIYLGAPNGTTVFAHDDERGKAFAADIVNEWNKSKGRGGGDR